MAAATRRKWKQLDLAAARVPCGRGGWRPGAGRPRVAGSCSHRARPRFAATCPQHVTLRIDPAVPSLRREHVARVVREVIRAGGHRDEFRVVHFNLLANHLHLLVEAAGQAAMSRGMQGLAVRLARRINAEFDRRGRLFAQRYHTRTLHTPREVRAVLRYILLNSRHHAHDAGVRLAPGWLDPFSSALWFDGWRAAPRTDAPWLRSLAREPCPTAPARTWLAAGGWRRGGGLIDLDDVPGSSG